MRNMNFKRIVSGMAVLVLAMFFVSCSHVHSMGKTEKVETRSFDVAAGGRNPAWCNLRAVRHRLGTARMEGAAGRHVERVGIGRAEMRIGHTEVWIRCQNGAE